MNAGLAAASSATGAQAAVSRALTLASLAVCWGALAFGGAYPWAFWPMAAIALAAGISGWRASAIDEAATATTLLNWSLGALGGAIATQLLPLPLAWVRTISPALTPVLEKTDFAYGAGLVRYHALSVDPAATVVALGLLASLGMLTLGLGRSLSGRQARTLVEIVTILGVLLALTGLVQKPLYAGRMLGFWLPDAPGTPFGPFVNRNHFAGWMLMALPLSLGLICAGLEHAMREVRPGLRHRILWLSSPEANRLVLLAAAASLMALSLLLTMSRSGVSALAVSMVLMAVVVARGLQGSSRKAVVGASLAAVILGGASWAGVDTLAARFANTSWSEFDDRRGAWLDALAVARDFPAAGTGLNTYSTVARFYQQHDLSRFYGEAHNDYLQVLAEGGALVALPALVCLVAFGREVRRRLNADVPGTSWWLRRAALTALLAIALQEAVEFSLQMPGNAVLCAVVCAIALHPARRTTRLTERSEPVASTGPRLRVVASNALAGSR